MTVLLARTRGALAAIRRGIVGTLVGPTTITTSTAATATAYSNQRKIDRCQNGVLWKIRNGESNSAVAASLAYSTDNGSSWTDAGTVANGADSTANTYVRNASFFIDIDDYGHLAFQDNGNGNLYYRRGTPNAARTSYTWSAPVQVVASAIVAGCNIVVHREGTGWVGHIAYSRASEGAWWVPITIASGGTITVGTATYLATSHVAGQIAYPSIDFRHTGDGKTVATAPDLYLLWSSGAAGAGSGLRFRMALYSAGSWAWRTEVGLDEGHAITGASHWMNCLFDGTRVVVAGFVSDGADDDLVIHDRDAADTTTTTRVLLDPGNAASSLILGSSTYDAAGNVYLFGRNADESAGTYDLVYRKWTRSTTTLDAEVVIDSGVGDPFVSAKRGYSNSKIEFIYTDGTASPYNVVYGGIS